MRPTLTIRPQDGHQFKAWTFRKWQRDWERRKRRAARLIYKALSTGATVTEHWEGSNRNTVWPEAAERCFIPSARTPAYLTGHIVSRMFGFGLAVEIQFPNEAQA